MHHGVKSVPSPRLYERGAGRCSRLGLGFVDDQRPCSRHLGRRAGPARRHRFLCVVNGLRWYRLLTRSQSGSALVGAIFGMLFILLLALGSIEVAFALYARNVVASAAHEGARAAIEVDRSLGDAAEIAQRTVVTAAGGLVSDLAVHTDIAMSPDGIGRSNVVVVAELRMLGPVPLTIPVRLTARASGQRTVP